MVSVPKVYRQQWRSLAVSYSWEAVSEGHEAVTEKSPGEFSSWEYKDENGACPYWIVKIEYRLGQRSTEWCDEIPCQETTSEDGES
jgi:hypothetical protein